MGPQQTVIRYPDSSFRHYYLCRYLPLSAGKDEFSHSLLKFKRRIQPDLDAWVDCSLEVLKEIPLSPETIILRALQHDETFARKEFPTALDILGQTLAANFNCRYLPSLLLKSRKTLPCKQLTRRQRLAELHDVYHIAPTPPTQTPPPFLLIDDILTTGATMRMLIHALRRQFPSCPIRIFTLTRADYASRQPKPLHGSNPEESSGWMQAENPPASYTAETLKSKIFANTV